MRKMNRQKLYQWMCASALCCASLFTACSDDDTPDPVDPATDGKITYTLMMYGCGGGNLDSYMQFNMDQVEGQGYTEKVNFTALLRYSEPYQEMDGYEGTRLFTMTEKGMTSEKKYEANYRLDNPKHLANFIVESQKRFPADHYVLVLWNHGGTFGLEDQLAGSDADYVESKGIVYDDNTNHSISIFEMEEAFKQAEAAGAKKLDVLYMDVCLMNMIENLYQIKDHADYVMGAAHLTPGLGGDYPDLIKSMEKHDNVEDMLKEYVPAAAEQWSVNLGEDNSGRDLVACRMDKLPAVITGIKEYTEQLCKFVENRDTEEAKVVALFSGSNQYPQSPNFANQGNLYYFANEPQYGYESSADLVSSFSRIAASTGSGVLSGKAGKVRQAMKEAIVATASSNLPKGLEGISVGIHWKHSAQFAEEDTEDLQGNPIAIKSFAQLYKNLAFDKATGWSRFLEKNEKRDIRVRTNAEGDMEVYDADEESEPGEPVQKYTWKVVVKLADRGTLTDAQVTDLQKLFDEVNKEMESRKMTIEAAKQFFQFEVTYNYIPTIMQYAIMATTDEETGTIPSFEVDFSMQADQEGAPTFGTVYSSTNFNPSQE